MAKGVGLDLSVKLVDELEGHEFPQSFPEFAKLSLAKAMKFVREQNMGRSGNTEKFVLFNGSDPIFC